MAEGRWPRQKRRKVAALRCSRPRLQQQAERRVRRLRRLGGSMEVAGTTRAGGGGPQEGNRAPAAMGGAGAAAHRGTLALARFGSEWRLGRTTMDGDVGGWGSEHRHRRVAGRRVGGSATATSSGGGGLVLSAKSPTAAAAAVPKGSAALRQHGCGRGKRSRRRWIFGDRRRSAEAHAAPELQGAARTLHCSSNNGREERGLRQRAAAMARPGNDGGDRGTF